ncbi:dolichol phosphate-mannose biosynthesis regulatory [Chytriomyces sp. MP71]|nr:dolichol phosphate-mannose biosynthesis regulatory [Chytriomyces sp. MP71]
MASSSDRLVGSVLLFVAAVVFLYYTTWTLILPLFDESSSLHAFFPDRVWALRIPVILIVVGGSLIAAFISSVLMKGKKKK